MSTRKPDRAKKPHKTDHSSGSSSFARISSSKKNQTYDTAKTGLDVMANIAEGSDMLAPLKSACRTTGSVIEIMQRIESNQEEWGNLARRLKDYMIALEEQTALLESYPQERRAANEAVSRPLIRYVESLEDVHDLVIDLKEKRDRSRLNLFKAFTKLKIDEGDIRALDRDIEDRHKQFMEALGLFTALRTQVIEQNTEITKANVEVTKANVETLLTDVDIAAILQLPTVAFVASSVHSTCMNGTRKAVLQTISSWADDSTSDKPIFWLCDIAGSGKSTVAMTAVASWRKQGVLGGRFFFSLASSEGSITDKFCSTIARELTQQMPKLAPHIAAIVKQNPDITRSSLEEQFMTLIVGPLRHHQERVILVLDALDECKSGSQRRELLETLSKVVRESSNLRIFMTSRPDPVIGAVLGSLTIKSKLEDRLHDIKHHDNIDDIAVYVHHSLDGVLPLDKRLKIVEKANGLFIWASTACRMLTSETTMQTPESIYERLISLNQVGVIDEIYGLVFERTDPESFGVMCEMLSVLLVAFEPLTIDELEDLLKQVGVQGSARALIKNLGSVLSADESTKLIQFRHPTLVEYLRRCSTVTDAVKRNKVKIDVANAHGQAASWCFKSLLSRTEGLKFNICQLESSFYLNRQISDMDARIYKFIPRKLRYASSNWLSHVAETDESWRSRLKSELKRIIKVPYVLYWMEVLSLIGGVPRAIAGLRAVTLHTGIEEETKSDMIETRRFLMAFAVPIQDSTPHIYISALPFTPKKSKIHLYGFDTYRNTLKVTLGFEEMYPGFPRTLSGHDGAVNAVSFSPDGSRAVSGSSDTTLRLWAADTGQPLGEPIRGHQDRVDAVVFSLDGLCIASGSSDKTIRLWDADTGQPLGKPLQGHHGPVTTIKFSPDGLRIASGSDDKTIRLWDMDTGQSVDEPMWGHNGSVNALAFSPDGLRIVSGSSDTTLRLWAADTGQPLGRPIHGHHDRVGAVVFSPDGSCIASGSSDKTIRLWDADTGQALERPIQGHRGPVSMVGFLPGGSRIVSASYDRTIRFWDPSTGKPLGEPILTYGGITSIGISPDGSQIISGFLDKMLRLWDVDTGQPLGVPVQEHQSPVLAVQFSPDGSRIVSGSEDCIIRFWDVNTGQPLGKPIQGHDGPVTTIKFSPDGLRIASGSDDRTIRLWDADTRQLLASSNWVYTDGSVKALVFSPDGSRIVSGSTNKIIQLWDTATCKPLGEPIPGHQGSVNALGFSPDGSYIVSGSHDKTIRLWNPNTRQPRGKPMRGHQGAVNTVEFSPNGSRIASGSEDNTIRMWDVDTGQLLGNPMRGHDLWVSALRFSPDGSRIVSASYDTTIRFWDAVTGQPLREPIRGHHGPVCAVGFSPDGSRIVSGSNDKTIRLWDASEGQLVAEPIRDHQSRVRWDKNPSQCNLDLPLVL